MSRNRPGVSSVRSLVAARWLFAVVVLALAACSSDSGTRTTSGDAPSATSAVSTSSTTSTTSAPSSSDAPAVSASATTAGIKLALTVEHGETDAGTRLWADLVITNVGPDAVFWQAGGCAIPGAITLTPTDGVARPDTSRGWDGDPSSFGEWARDHNALDQTIPLRDEEHVGWLSVACTSDSRMAALNRGDSLHQRAAADVRVAPDGIASDGRYVANATFRSYANPNDYGYQQTDHPRPDGTVSVPIQVSDVSARTRGDSAVAAFAAADALGQFVDRTRTVEVDNTWTTTVSWWRGAWELWVTPYYGKDGEQSLRLRYDTKGEAIVDARVVWNGQPPQDDPDGHRPPGDRPDDLMRTGSSPPHG